MTSETWVSGVNSAGGVGAGVAVGMGVGDTNRSDTSAVCPMAGTSRPAGRPFAAFTSAPRNTTSAASARAFIIMRFTAFPSFPKSRGKIHSVKWTWLLMWSTQKQ